jgi:hypothetical protein
VVAPGAEHTAARCRCPRRHAGLLLLLAAAAGQIEGDPHAYVAGMLWRAGWARRDGTPLDRWDARAAAAETYVVLVRLGALVPDCHSSGPGRPTADGAVFARAALRTWPSAS